MSQRAVVEATGRSMTDVGVRARMLAESVGTSCAGDRDLGVRRVAVTADLGERAWGQGTHPSDERLGGVTFVQAPALAGQPAEIHGATGECSRTGLGGSVRV